MCTLRYIHCYKEPVLVESGNVKRSDCYIRTYVLYMYKDTIQYVQHTEGHGVCDTRMRGGEVSLKLTSCW